MLIDFLKGRPCCRNLRRATSPSLRVSGGLPPPHPADVVVIECQGEAAALL